jgi:gamma-glutamyltranspeptidase/glutathione hydrolase
MTDRSRSRSNQAYNGMVASPHSLASGAGLAALLDGGSAMDAAIAANAVLTVVYPDQTSIGGDCFFIAYDAASRSVAAYNGSGRAPLAADREALRRLGEGSMPKRGIHAVTVPGTIDAWYEANERFCRLPMERLLQPAIDYAGCGFPVSHRLSQGIAAAHDLLKTSDFAASTYLVNGEAPEEGHRLRLPALSQTLARIVTEGRVVFYSGEIAESISATSANLGGTLSMYDLAGHRGEWVRPLAINYRGVTVAEMPPNSQGLTALLALNLVQQVDLGDTWGTIDHLHPLIEAKKLAFAVRDQRLADPRFVSIDAEAFTSQAFADDLWRHYDPRNALVGSSALPGDTVAISAVDRDGNAVSLIQSIYQGFGSGVIAGETGIVLQNRGAYFSLDEDHPNRLEPGKRTLHTLMPAMLLDDHGLIGPLATQGGDAQAQVHLQLVTDLIDFEMLNDPQVAVDAPRWLAGGGPDEDPRTVLLETRFTADVLEGLASRGHRLKPTTTWDPHAGHAQVILRDPVRGLLLGAADPRADGAALGY